MYGFPNSVQPRQESPIAMETPKLPFSSTYWPAYSVQALVSSKMDVEIVQNEWQDKEYECFNDPMNSKMLSILKALRSVS